METLPLDTTMMAWYHVSDDESQYLMNFLQTQFCYANPYIRNALLKMVIQMQSRMLEMLSLNDKALEQEHEISQLKIKNRELEELNETLDNENQRIPVFQVSTLYCRVYIQPF